MEVMEKVQNQSWVPFKALDGIDLEGSLTYINCISVRWAMNIQDVFTASKLLALFMIIITGAVRLYQGHTKHLTNVFDADVSVGDFSLGLYSSLFAYGGWNYLNFVTEEMKEPHKNLPRAIIIAIPLVTLVYVFVNVAYFTVVSPMEMMASPAVAVTFGNRMFDMMAWIVPVFVALSTFGGVNGLLFTSSRLFCVGAREGHLPNFMSMMHIQKCTPTPALLFTVSIYNLLYHMKQGSKQIIEEINLESCLTLEAKQDEGSTSLIMLSSTNIFSLINYFSFATWLWVGIAVCGMLWLRYNRPNAPRPIIIPVIIPILFLACCLFLVVVPLYAQPFETGMGLLLILSGLPIYLLFISGKYESKRISKMTNWCSVNIQKFLLVIEAEESVKS
ncbi:Large neutral amino acids transporter small subunit 2 [Nymphon striatum]|nr:Large neutral amino acids transporter small subunit 2 [Nymphon striatum]